MKYPGWFLFGAFSIAIGCYPLLYGLVDMSQGFLGGKTAELLNNDLWNWFFYQHISFGAVSMLVGWIQFSKKVRNRWLPLHRLLGKMYVISVLLSGVAGFYLSFFATGGSMAGFGFGSMAFCWLGTTLMAYITIRQGDTQNHRNWMIRSYALCWAAVTLRIYIPTFQIFLGLDFITAYLWIAWLCWVPNLLVAEGIIRWKTQKRETNLV